MGDKYIWIKVDQLANLIVNLSASQKQVTQTALDIQTLAQGKKREIKTQLELSDELAEVLGQLICKMEEIVPFLACPVTEAGESEAGSQLNG